MPLRSIRIALLATGLALAGCHRASEEPQPDNQAIENTAPEPPPSEPTQPVVEPLRTEAARPTPAPEPSADQQVQDDADATGMTSRVSRDGESSDAGAGNQQ